MEDQFGLANNFGSRLYWLEGCRLKFVLCANVKLDAEKQLLNVKA